MQAQINGSETAGNGVGIITQLQIVWMTAAQVALGVGTGAAPGSAQAAAIAAGQTITLSAAQDLANYYQATNRGVSLNAAGVAVNPGAALAATTTYYVSTQTTDSSFGQGNWSYTGASFTTTSATTTAAPTTTSAPTTTTTAAPTTTAGPTTTTTSAPGTFSDGTFTASDGSVANSSFVTTAFSGSYNSGSYCHTLNNQLVMYLASTSSSYASITLTDVVTKAYYTNATLSATAATLPAIANVHNLISLNICNAAGSCVLAVQFDGTGRCVANCYGGWTASQQIINFTFTAGDVFGLKLTSPTTCQLLHNGSVLGTMTLTVGAFNTTNMMGQLELYTDGNDTVWHTQVFDNYLWS